MRIALTGGTGLLGSNLILEILKNNYKNLSDLEIIFFGRDSKEKKLSQRIYSIIKEDVLDYIDDPELEFSAIANWLEENTNYVNFDFADPNIKVSDESIKMLKSKKIDFFFHVAALTNLWNDEKSKRDLDIINYQGTINIVNLVKELKVGEFIYVGTAYQCGKTYGDIEPDYINLNQEFRSYYELVKLKAEIYVREFEKETGQKCRYFRPSVICGRLIEKPKGAINKFDVIYGWGLFMLNLKKRYVKDINNLMEEECNINLRYIISFESGLNIVPADFCAKVMWLTCIKDHKDNSFYLSYTSETKHLLYLSTILKYLKIKGVAAAKNFPKTMNKDELFYYRTAGKVFNPYMTAPEMRFDVSNITSTNYLAPLFSYRMDETDFDYLMKFATLKRFGDK